MSQPTKPELLPLRAWHPPHRVDRALDLRPIISADRPTPRRRCARTAPAGLSPPAGDQHLAPVVSPRGRCRTTLARTFHLSRPCPYLRHLLVSQRHAPATTPGVASDGTSRRRAAAMNSASSFPALLEAFFTDRLMRQRHASAHTIVSYRDTFRLLLQYAQRRLRTP